MIEKKLGKITNVRYGFGGYQDVQFGLSITLGNDGWGVGDFWGFWADEPSPGAKWDMRDQKSYFGETTFKILRLMQKAKVKDVTKLKGIPVEVVFDRNSLQSWRVLGEVL